MKSLFFHLFAALMTLPSTLPLQSAPVLLLLHATMPERCQQHCRFQVRVFNCHNGSPDEGGLGKPQCNSSAGAELHGEAELVDGTNVADLGAWPTFEEHQAPLIAAAWAYGDPGNTSKGTRPCTVGTTGVQMAPSFRRLVVSASCLAVPLTDLQSGASGLRSGAPPSPSPSCTPEPPVQLLDVFRQFGRGRGKLHRSCAATKQSGLPFPWIT